MFVIYAIFAASTVFEGQPQAPSVPAAPVQRAPVGEPPYSQVDSQQVVIDLPALKFFCDGRQDVLKRYLEAAPHWRVGVKRNGAKDVTVAYRRSGERITLSGYIGSRAPYRVGFVLEPEPGEPAFMSPCVTRATPDAGATVVAICSYQLTPKQRRAMLFIGVPGLWLATVEVDPEDKLARTTSLLADVERELHAVRNAAEASSPLSCLGPEAMRKSPPSILIDDEEQQMLHLEAWLNPGEPGVTEIRAKSGDGTKDLSVSHAHLYVRERVGYSSDPNQTFYANSCFWIKEAGTGFDTKHDVLIQLWFIPDSGGPPRLLIEKRQAIKGYEN
jgi:hypothetical protein